MESRNRNRISALVAGLACGTLLVVGTTGTFAAQDPPRHDRMEATEPAAEAKDQVVRGRDGAFPDVEAQLEKAQVVRGSELEHVIRANQDFGMLDPREATDRIRVPAWARVMWRKAHPEMTYDANDPAGGYPHVLKEIVEWMERHQDLRTGPREADILPSHEKTAVGTNLRISGAQSGARSESDIRVNYWDPSKIIAGSNNIGGSGRQAQFWSTDGGATWGQTTLPLATGDAFNSDPTVDWTSDGVAWSSTLGINSAGSVLKLRVYRSTDNGATWTLESTPSGTQSAVDKQMKWVDHSATSPYKNNIYIIYHNNAPCYIVRRDAATGTWNSPVQVSGTETTGTAIGADIKTNAYGDVFGFWPATGNRRILVAKSTNGGSSFATPVTVATTYDSYDIGMPAFNNRRMLIYVSAGAYRTATKNMVYATWADLSGETGCTTATNEPGSSATSACKVRVWFSRSTNGGSTWSTPVKINNQAGKNDQFNPWMAVDETNGQVAIIYYDTVNDVNRKKTDVYYQISSDDGATFGAPVRVTTAMTDETTSGADSGNQYGDYNSLSGYAGKFFPSWTDRRSGGYEEIWTAPITETACTAPAAPTGLTATANGIGRIDLAWTGVSGITEYHLLRGNASGGPYSQIAVTSGTTWSDTGLPAGTYYYVVRAFKSCESANSNQASATAAGDTSCTTQTLYTTGFEGVSGMTTWSKGTFKSGGSTTSWRGVQACTAQTGSNIFRYGGSNCTANYGNGDYNYALMNGTTGVTVPAGATKTTLNFAHRRRFESGYDGGTIAVSLNGTNYTFVPASAISAGAYNGQIAASCAPTGTAGTSVWTGVSTTFTNTTIDLDAVCNQITGLTAGCGGQKLWIAFTAISDCSTNDDGWFLDNVNVTSCTK